MSKLLNRIRTLTQEFRRRKVTGVLVAYVVFGAGFIQLADILANQPDMNLPENTVTIVLYLALAGLPLAALLAWLYDLVPDRGSDAPAADNVLRARVVAAEGPPDLHARRAGLPTPATPFIGRDDELRELCWLLTEPTSRLVTVTGPGGVGKTRLALEAAHMVAAKFRDGVVYRALSSLATADLLLPALAESLGVPLSRRDDPLAELQSFLSGRELLLVLDNFEHLTEGAALLATLLDHAPDVRILVTSRERLSLQHEMLIGLEGLPLGDDVHASDAVQLFVTGARRLDRRFELNAANDADVAGICTLLDGIPLAIELASAWVRALSCAEIRAELERGLDILSSETHDLDQRHHSLRATFDSSWRLLSAEEQSALARLTVFRSTFDRSAAAAIADADMPLLRQLVDKSLLNRTGDRLLMLDVIRTFALERLAADPAAEERARERHMAWFADLLHAHQAAVQRGDHTAIMRVARCIDECRAAWSHATSTGNSKALLHAMDGLFHFYEARGWAREGAEVFGRTSAALGENARSADAPHSVRLTAARLDVRHGVFLQRLGDLRGAESLLRRGVALARELEDRAEIAFALHRLGAVRHGMGDYAQAEQLHEEGWALARELDDRHAIGWSMTYLGNVAWSRGEFDRATQLYTEAMRLLREERDLNGLWVTLNNLGVLAASRHDYDEAQRRFQEGLALQAGLNNPRIEANTLHNLGGAARERGDLANARRWLDESLEISERMGYRSMSGLTLVALAELAILENDDERARTALHRALRTASAARNNPLALEALLNLARLRLRQDDAAGAAELAAIVMQHPGSDGDVRQKTAELLAQIDVEPPTVGDTPDLNALIDRIIEEDVVPASARAAPRHSIAHAQSAGDP
jgi:predicted ATPase/Tfp pilus assembly protein PilF